MADDQIKNVKLSFSCPENWDNMAPTQGGRHCDKCNKTVHDFTNSKVEEFRIILAESSNGICGRFKKEQMAPVIIPKWRKWISAALVLIGFNLFFKNANAQSQQDLKIHKKALSEELPFNGLVLAPDAKPSFPGGYKKFQDFLGKNLNPDVIQCMEGRELVSFVVEKNGSISNIKIIQSIHPQADKEVIRVLKLSPKWIPANINGKKEKSAITIPVVLGQSTD